MRADLRGEVVLVTGAAQGLGRAIAERYAREGMRLALLDVLGEALATVAAELRAQGADCLPITVDLSDAEATDGAITAALAHYGTPRVLVHNAALLVQRSMLEITLAQWRHETDIILQAGFQLCKAVWPEMIAAGGGAIILLTSGSGVRGFANEIAYCPAKHGIEGLAKCLAIEGAPYNITANAVTPGAPINTPMSAANYDEASKARWVDPAAITEAFVALARHEVADGLSGRRIAARVGALEVV